MLTRAERDAIARLREQRAQGRAPLATTHRAPLQHADPLVTFYAQRKAPPTPKPRPKVTPTLPVSPFSHVLPNRRNAPNGHYAPPHPPKPKTKPVPKPRPPQEHTYKTAHQQKAAVRRAARQAADRNNDTETTESHPLKPASRPAAAWNGVKSALNARVPKGNSEIDSDSDASNADEGPSQWDFKRKPAAVVEAIKGLSVWQAMKRDRSIASVSDKSSSSFGGMKEGKENQLHRIKWATKKKFGDVKTKLGGASATGERFVLKQKPDVSDLGEVNDDRYFQDLMNSES